MTGDRRASRQSLIAALWLGGAMAAGLSTGAALRIDEAASVIAIPALGLQTLLTVGALPGVTGDAGLRPGLTLVAVHYAVATLPVVALAALLGLDQPLGFGFFLIAIAPPAALIPAYADVARVNVANLLVFCLAAYALALVLTPGLLLVVAGTTVGIGSIAATLGIGLIGPSLLGRALHSRIVRIPQAVRRAVINASVFVITLSLGNGLVEGLRSPELNVGVFLLVLTLVVARVVGGGWLAERVAPTALSDEAPFAGAFKNIALAAAVAGVLFGPVAALPGLLAFPVETAYFLVLARRGPRRAEALADTQT